MKEVFEIHITGEPEIIKWLERRNYPYLAIKMLDRDLQTVSLDCMSAIKLEVPDLFTAQSWVIERLCELNSEDINVYRVKIEAPPLDKYLKKCLYIERHWKTSLKNVEFPLSYVVNKTKYVATERCYDKKLFKQFSEQYEKTEVCLIDTNINHDKNWFKIWNY